MDAAEERRARIAALTLPAEAAGWARAGFAVEGERTTIGTVPVSFGAGWEVELDFRAIDEDPPQPPPATQHPIGAVAIDHVVLFTPSLERTIESYEGQGLRCRRVREVGEGDQMLRQAFFRLDEVILEVVQVPAEQVPDGPRFWGLTITVVYLDGAVADLGSDCGTIRDAVQPGRRIATLKRSAGLSLPVALMTPPT